jgi:hypothetical protein
MTLGFNAGANGILIADGIVCHQSTFVSPVFVERDDGMSPERVPLTCRLSFYLEAASVADGQPTMW